MNDNGSKWLPLFWLVAIIAVGIMVGAMFSGKP